MIHARLRDIAIGIVCGAILDAVPSFMILRGLRANNMQEAVLWAVQFVACAAAGMFFADSRRQQITTAAYGYGFLLLYNALAILCATLGYGIITWTGLSTAGLVLVVCTILTFCLLAPKVSHTQLRTACLLCTTTLLAGISFVYCSWLPLLVIPGALVLVVADTLPPDAGEHR